MLFVEQCISWEKCENHLRTTFNISWKRKNFRVSDPKSFPSIFKIRVTPATLWIYFQPRRNTQETSGPSIKYRLFTDVLMFICEWDALSRGYIAALDFQEWSDWWMLRESKKMWKCWKSVLRDHHSQIINIQQMVGNIVIFNNNFCSTLLSNFNQNRAFYCQELHHII